MNKHSGRLELTWSNKDKALLSTGDGKYDYTFVERTDYRVSEVRLLHEVELVSAPTPETRPAELPAPTSDNLLITGDSMHVLDALSKIPEYAERYVGKVKLVYIDPPFNTEQAFEHYEDNIEHSIWLTMLRDRLRQIRPLLTRDGSVWVHLDDAEVHRCRVVLDEEFGESGFISSIVWQKRVSRENRAAFSESHDWLLVYARQPKSTWRHSRNRLPRNDGTANPDGDPRGPWDSVPFTAQGFRANEMYPITTPTEVVHQPPKGRCWGATQAEYERLLGDNRIFFPRNGDGKPRVKQFVSEAAGLVPHTIWLASEVGDNDRAKKESLNSFPEVAIPFDTPKPEALLQRIIAIATNPGDIVLDCFAGSGTTAAVAHKMGRRWVTSELLPATLETFTKPRLAKVVRGEDPGGVTSERTKTFDLGDDDSPPAGTSPHEADKFNTVLTRLTKIDGIELDAATIRALRGATRTRAETATIWHGGGGFTHLVVGPSMFTEVEGMVLLADWAAQTDLAVAMCAQLSVRYRPEGIFVARRGRTRYVVIDGMVGPSTIDAIVDRLVERETVEVWATQLDPDARDALTTYRPGSTLNAIPSGVLDRYRRKQASRSAFAGPRKDA